MAEPATAVATRTDNPLALIEGGKGVYRQLPELLDAFEKMREKFNVCFPVMRPDVIPVLHAVALRPVSINPDTRLDEKKQCVSPDLYFDSRAGKYGLSKIALDKIAAAAGLSWHPAYTGRVDDQSDPHFRCYRACGVVSNLDGTPRVITAHKTVDLRDGAPHGMSANQLAEARKHIDALCESKAMNRVIRKYAFIKGLYTPEELRRPFVIAASVFTGETDDPELRREVARALVERSKGAAGAIFGPAAAAPQQIEDLGTRTAPPPLGTSRADDRHPGDDDHDDDGDGDQSGLPF